MNLSFNASLQALNTFAIACKEYALASFADKQELDALLQHPAVSGRPHMVLGGGSNLLFTRDYEGVVLLNRVKGIQLTGVDDAHFFVRAGAGERDLPVA